MFTKTELLSLPVLNSITNLNPIITKFFNDYLGHLNIKSSVIQISSITLDVVAERKTLQVSMPYSNSYKEYTVWQIGILKYMGLPNLVLFNDLPNSGPIMYRVGDVNITKTILYLLSQEMEVVQDGFSYNAFDAVLNYRDDPQNIKVLE